MSGAAVGAKTARACDNCVRRRARWYCAADDAFLCQACDASVHSANALARRHERVRLNTASLKCSPMSDDKPCIPSWPHRRPRTPRHGKYPANTHVTMANVPEIGRSCTTTTTTSRDDEYDETDQLQLLYRVPVLDPLLAELCSSSAGESKYTEMMLHDDSPEEGFLPSLNLNLDLDLDMEDFAADMESFLGEAIEGESYDDLGLLVKEEEEEETLPFELNFDCNSPVASSEAVNEKAGKDEKREWRMSLRLDYDAISTAWATQGSPWMNGERPQISPNDCWFHSTVTMGSSTTVRAIGGQSGNGDGGREARVSRYREKRRTRLFSKKIRYEVRKLNAEKRPRMKGRFVKRSSFNPTPTPFPLLTK